MDTIVRRGDLLVIEAENGDMLEAKFDRIAEPANFDGDIDAPTINDLCEVVFIVHDEAERFKVYGYNMALIERADIYHNAAALHFVDA